jgi:chromosome segregation protein
MLRLERLEISGFKSFHEKADIAFPGSVTAIVGPNGCGKSNICDAVAWVLGEQSARLLRSERMDDVIFSGSAVRRPLGLAEVTLTLRSDDGDLGEHGQVASIGRRVYRDGEGEYFINGKRVRLRDVQDLLLGTGLGVRAYSIIEQGRVEQVLSGKPQDRRRLIEEAAGITRYKLRKRAAELKLEETRGNLLRLNDIVAEVERNCSSLKRQASRAARYREQQETCRSLRSLLVRWRYDRLRADAEGAERALAAHRAAEAEASAQTARSEADLEEARRRASDKAEARDRAQQALAALIASIERDDALLEGLRRTGAENGARREAVARELSAVAEELQRREQERLTLESLRDERQRESAERRLHREQAVAESDRCQRELADIEAALASDQRTAAEIALRRAETRNALHEIDVEFSRISASRSRIAAARERAAEAATLLGREVAEAEAEERRLSVIAAETALRLSDLEEETRAVAARTRSDEHDRDAARERLWSAEQRMAVLGDVLRSRETGEGAAADTLRRAELPAAGILADRLAPVEGWEEVLDFLLGPDLEAIVTSSSLEKVAHALRHEGGGAASIVREAWRGSRAPAARRPDGPQVLGGWEAVLRNAAELSEAVRAALPEVWFVDRLEDALALSETAPAATLVTRTREIVRGSLVRIFGEDSPAEGVFTIRRDLEQLRQAREEADSEVRRAIESLDTARRRLEQIEEARRADAETRRVHETKQSAFAARLDERRAELERQRREIETLEAEDQMLAAEADTLSTRRAELEQEDAEQTSAEVEGRRTIEQRSLALGQARATYHQVVEQASAARTQDEVSRQRVTSLEETLATLSGELDATSRRRAAAEIEQQRLERANADLSAEISDALARRHEGLGRRGALESSVEAAAAEADQLTAGAAAAEQSAREARSLLDARRQTRFDSELLKTRVSGDLDHLVEEAEREFGKGPEGLPAAEAPSPERLAEVEAEAQRLAESLEKMGPVNVLAFEEYQEQAERLTFLTTQRDDLNQSIAQLQETIRKINATSSERFAAAFSAINAHFVEMFAHLFRGGRAEMRLLDENDLLESGVEIIAQPPGKRNQSIQLLSGGEKALTAIALLMAIFRYKPSPFCILDEVDAPLDEANIDRFTRILREMTEETQFIAITHNKRTMETADVLYGVTMEEPGCSKIVSVKFD